MKQYICLDISNSFIKYGIIDDMGHLIVNSRESLKICLGGSHILSTIIRIAEKYINQYSVSGIGISTVGTVDWNRGKILYASPKIPNYTGMHIKQIVEEKLGIPCEVENQINCIGLTECHIGAARNTGVVFYIRVGAEAEGTFLLHRQVYHGVSGCGCNLGGLYMPGGLFRDLAGSRLLIQKVARWKQIPEDMIDGRYIFEQAKAGDIHCIRSIDEMMESLGIGIANICLLLNPEMIVIGGGLSRQREYLYPRLKNVLETYLDPILAKKTRLVFAEVQNHPGLLGAYYHFRNRKH